MLNPCRDAASYKSPWKWNGMKSLGMGPFFFPAFYLQFTYYSKDFARENHYHLAKSAWSDRSYQHADTKLDYQTKNYLYKV